MFYHICQLLTPVVSLLNVIHYVSFRAMAALLTTLLLSFIFGHWFIETSRRVFRSKARPWTPEHHKSKDDMPTMGGLFMMIIATINILLWCNLTDPYVWIFLFNMIGFGAIGFYDDWQKIKKNRGMTARTKFFLQVFVSSMVACLLLLAGLEPFISFPFFKHIHPYVGLFFIPWIMLILIGCSNAVNLTDGLDGLAINSLIPNFATFSAICFLAGNATIACYLHIPFAQSAEITVVGAILVGVSLGFLWYNAYPAQIFMGDVGSLALGSSLALMALISKQELLLVIAGGLFVLEAVSVIMQVLSFKLLSRRIFKMAPIHHHFELLGWQESKITVRFGIISLILCLIALMTLKIR